MNLTESLEDEEFMNGFKMINSIYLHKKNK